ncbi:hypothetical protein hrd7_32980 (plasmid) [Leptolinea sp. HRD-7]|nr:hypothetical protein hrd7_32980 [Leptolinea sp. HRD-7]
MDILFFTHLLNSILMIIMPIGLAIYLTYIWKPGWRIWFIGAATFILSQIGHIPFNMEVTQLLKMTPLAAMTSDQSRWFNIIFLGLSASVFEEGARYLVLKFWLKDARSWRKSVVFGAGHGGVEAIILGGFALFTFFQFTGLRNINLENVLPAAELDSIQQQVTAYWSADWTLSLMGSLERLFTIPIHIACAVLVMQAFTRKQGYWLGLAILYHAVVDSCVVASVGVLNTYGSEAVVGLFALLGLALIFVLRQPEPLDDSKAEIHVDKKVFPTLATENNDRLNQ